LIEYTISPAKHASDVQYVRSLLPDHSISTQDTDFN
jgi:hypothetical protein